ncbi:MAG: endolytic transglycosylase MltG [Candidatus Symbiothrix sp.]|nr:endolytic transglycosylase MltG [Candidatus Symbiothrix sp.]
MKKKFLFFAVVSCVCLLISGGGYVCYAVRQPAFELSETASIYLYKNQNPLSELKAVGRLRQPIVYRLAAKLLRCPDAVRAGKYDLTPDMSYLDAVRMLRNGTQTPVRLTFNNIRTKKDFAERIGKQLRFDADSLLALLNNPQTAAAFELDTNTILTMFLPNTYEIYWTVSAPQFMERMQREYAHFWTSARRSQAQAIGLTPTQVSILAAIVAEETNKADEYPMVAGLYLNRLNKKMLLQADPTVKFAVGDFGLRRILNVHVQTDSPYNTYKYTGLPPGPIRIPSIPAIDGVLNRKQHNYLYMCAKEDFSGRHNFAVTYNEHLQNARRYHAALNQRKIK